jgi:iron complex outermembrane recepter protein
MLAKKPLRKIFGASLLITSALVVARIATAAPEAAADRSATDQGSKLEEIIVTARRREENAQTVPIAITVVSPQSLQDNNVQTLGDLQSLVPSMTTSTGFTRDAITVSIRGQGQNPTSGLPGVVAYLNEVPIPTVIAGDLAGGPGMLFDLENVQALKGPQGTLFGRNSVGGDLLLQTARPTDEFGGHFQVGYGNYNDREIDGAINLPISEALLTRFAFNGQVRDGFTHLLGDPVHPGGIDADNRDYYSARETVTLRPNEVFQNDTMLTFTNYESHGSPMILTAFDPKGVFASFPGVPSLFAQQQALGIRAAVPIDTSLASSGTFLALSNASRITLSDQLTFRNVFGYDKSTTVTTTDFDATVLPLLDVISTPQNDTSRQYSDEVQLLGKNLDGRLDWVAGAFFLHEVSEPFTQTSIIFFGESDKIYGGFDDTKAVYAQGSYDLGSIAPGLKVTGGLRYTWDNSALDQQGGAVDSVCLPPTANCSTTASYHANSSALTYTAGIDYQVAPDSLLYLTSRRGYRAGSYNIPADPVPEYGPEFVQDVELGIKSDWKVGNIAVRTNADLYYQDYRDIQVQQNVISPAAGLVAVTDNAAGARITGAEFEVLAQLTRDLQLGATFDYLDFQYTAFNTGVTAATIAGLESTRSTGRPPRKYGVNARYALPLASDLGDVSVRANWIWQASNGDVSQPGGLIDSYGLLNMAADWNGIGGTHLDASLFGANLTDKVYSVGVIALYSGLGYSLTRFGEPRMYGIRLRYRFGGESK